MRWFERSYSFCTVLVWIALHWRSKLDLGIETNQAMDPSGHILTRKDHSALGLENSLITLVSYKHFNYGRINALMARCSHSTSCVGYLLFTAGFYCSVAARLLHPFWDLGFLKFTICIYMEFHFNHSRLGPWGSLAPSQGTAHGRLRSLFLSFSFDTNFFSLRVWDTRVRHSNPIRLNDCKVVVGPTKQGHMQARARGHQ